MKLIDVEVSAGSFDSIDTIKPIFGGCITGIDMGHLHDLLGRDVDITSLCESTHKKGDFRSKYERCNAHPFIPKKVIFNPPATIVFWKDGTKTIVKCGEDDIFDEEIGLAMAIAQKVAGDRSKFKKIVKKASRPQEKHTL